MKHPRTMRLLAITLGGALLAFPGAVLRAEFQPEPVGVVGTLPAQYPAHWVLIHDLSFFHMLEGRVIVVDPLAATIGEQYKGAMTASFISGFQQGRARNENYVIETFYSRGGRGGERTDMVTVYDPSTLEVTAEIGIPPKRLSGMPKTIATGLIDDGRFLGVYNFTPSQSVSIVDLAERRFVTEVATAGCGFVLPNGQRSFTSICANGSLLTVHLAQDGTLDASERSAVAFDPEADPIFESVGVAGDVAHFPTFQGRILPIDVSGEQVSIQPTWWLTGEDERNWRPGGLVPITVDSAGAGYLLMNEAGAEGTHKDGGGEVWVFDLASHQRTGRFALKNWGLSLGASGTGDQRLLLVTNTDMTVDVYRAPAGSYVQTLDVGADTPFLVYGAH